MAPFARQGNGCPLAFTERRCELEKCRRWRGDDVDPFELRKDGNVVAAAGTLCELFGNGVYEYLRTERMLEARQLLSDRNRNVKEVAALTGYKSVNSFIKAFKKKYGETPGEYRKRG